MTALSDELEALLKAATPGKWVAHEDPTQDGDHVTMVVLPGKNGQFETWLAGCIHNWQEASYGERRISWKEAEGNAALIVALVNNAPRMIEALRASEMMDEDWLEETISDSLEMDWHPRDAARLIIQRLAPPATEAGE